MTETKTDSQQLIDAMNLLAEYTMQNLAEGWYIEFDMQSGECSCELYNPHAEHVHVDAERGESVIETMCRISHEVEE